MVLETLMMLFEPVIIFTIVVGVTAGLFVGAMPGLTATMALAVLLPFTFTLPPLHGLVALGAVYMGAIYGGSFAAILVNTPGTPSSIATAFEGYPMSTQGRALEALSIATVGSAIGGETRFTFGMPVLQGGVPMIVALIGLFVLPELYNMAAKGKTALTAVKVESKARSSFWRATKTVFSMPGNLIRSCTIGEIVAIIPGAGGNVANLVAYNEAKRASKHPEKFGTGVPEGLVATESSNNVTVAGSMVPLLTLGIPGAPPDAVILGVMMLHGLRPGIELFTTSGHLTYGFIISMGLAAIVMVPVGLLGGRLIYKIIFRTPVYFLVPTIAMATMLGTYAVRNSHTDVIIMLILGTMGFLFKQVGIGPAPIVLGLILGKIAEMGYIQTMLTGQASQYPAMKLFESGLSHILIGMILFSVAWPFLSTLKRRISSRRRGSQDE